MQSTALQHLPLDKLPSTVMALMMVFAVVNVPILLILGGLTLWIHVADDHGLRLTSAGLGSDGGQQSPRIVSRVLHGHHYHCAVVEPVPKVKAGLNQHL
jgi:hypothetical protein